MRLRHLFSNKILILFIILLIGAFVRFYKLDFRSLWYDEAASLSFTEYSLGDIWTHRYMAKPIYFILLRAWVNLFGYSEFATRFLAAIFGVLSIFLIYKLAKALFNYRVGLFSALILALSCYHIYYSQQVRNYTLLVLLGLLSMLFFIRILKENKFTLYLSYTFINVFLLYTHPYGLFVVIVQNILLLFLWTKINIKRRWIITQIVILLFFIPVIATLVSNPESNEIDYVPKPKPYLLLETLETFSYGGPRQAHGGVGFKINSERLAIPRTLTFVFCGLFILGLISSKKTNLQAHPLLDYHDRILLVVLWLGATIIGAYLFSKIFFPIYMTRYLIATAPAFYIVVAKGITQLPRPAYRVTTIFIILILSVFSLNVLYNSGPEGNWKELASYIKENIKEGDRIVFVPLRQIVPFWYYYKYRQKRPLKDIDRYGKRADDKWQSEFFNGSNFILGIGLDSTKELIINKLRKLTNEERNIWLIISPDWIGRKKSQLVKRYLEEFYVIKSKNYYDYNGVELLHYALN